DAPPIRLLRRARDSMALRDRRLQAVVPEPALRLRPCHRLTATTDGGGVPPRAILIGELNGSPARIQPRGEARRLELHQSDEPVGTGSTPPAVRPPAAAAARHGRAPRASPRSSREGASHARCAAAPPARTCAARARWHPWSGRTPCAA